MVTRLDSTRTLAAVACLAAIVLARLAGAVSSRPGAGRHRARLAPAEWTHLSSATGDLAAPGESTQQTGAVVADLDKDGKNDFVLSAREKGPCLVWYRRTRRGWDRYVLDPDNLPIEAGGTVCDIDGDGDPDIVIGGDFSSNAVWWWENPYPRYDPKVPWKRHAIKAGGGTQQHDQLFGDFFGDGKQELVFWNQGATRLFMASIPKDPRTAPSWPYHEIYSGSGEGLASGDLDGDGRLDLVIGGRWLRNDGAGRFTPIMLDPNQLRSRVAVGDLNGDGRPDLVMSPGEEGGRLNWYENTGNPTDPISWKVHDLLGEAVLHAHSLAIADIDGDGHADIFCAEMAKWTESAKAPDNPKARMWIFYGDGKGGFSPVLLATGVGNHESRVADLDGDGRPDILDKPYNWETPRIDVWLQRPRIRGASPPGPAVRPGDPRRAD